MNPKPQYLKVNKTLGLICSLILSAAASQAADIHWTAGTDTYNNAANWGGTLPGGGDNAIVNNGGTVLINPTDPNWTVNDIRAAEGSGSVGTCIQDGPTVTFNGWFRIAVGGGSTGSYTLKSGTITDNGHLTVGEGGTGVLNMTNTATPNVATVAGELWLGNTATGNGTVNLGGNASLTVNNWLAIGRDSSTGVLNLSGNATVTRAGANPITFAGINGAGTANGTINQSGNSTVNCGNNDTWLSEDGVGTWNLNSGTVTIATLQFGRNGGSSGTFNLNGGTLSVNQITLGNGSGTLNFNGGTLRPRGANANFMSGVSAMLQAGGAVIDTQGFDITIPGVIADAAGGSLTKVGNGTLELSGANTYIGSTIVSGGKLIEDTTSTVTSGVTVANGAGYGVGLAAANGQVTHSSVTFSGAANSFNLVLGNYGNPTVAPLVATSLINNGATTINISDDLAQVGQFPMISYTTKSGAGSFVLGTLPAGVSAVIVDNVANKSIDLNITSTALVRWAGQVAGGFWDINTTTNWTDYLSGLPAKFTTGGATYFDDFATSGTTTVNIGVAVSPGSITVTNDILPYTFTGVGSITGSTGLTKQGTNNLTIIATNSYTGPTTISGGTVTVNALGNGVAPSPLGLSSTNVASLVLNGGTLSYTGPATSTDRGYTLARSSTLDVQGDITFNGTANSFLGANFTKSGNGTLAYKLPGVATLSGGNYIVQNGSVVMDGSAGGQTNIISSELWAGGTTSSTGGSLILTNTTLNLSSWLSIARGTGTGGYTSSITMYNSKLRSGNGSMAYDNGIAGTYQTAILTLNGTSTYTNTGDSNMGESGGAMAIINLNDSSVFYGQNRMMLGWHTSASGPGTNIVTVANSAKIVCNAWMSIGNEGGTGSVLLKDSATLSVALSDLNVCDVNTGSGTLVAQNSSQITANNIFVGKGNGSVGYMLITNNATALSFNGLTMGSGVSSSATLDLSGGSLAVNLLQGSPASGSTSTLNFNGGKLIAHPPYFGSNFVFNLEAANILAGGAVIEINSNDVRNIPQPLLDGGGNGGLTKVGNGTLLLDGANTYTGTTTVSAGTLGGSGTISGPVVIAAGAKLAPGDSIGTLTLNGTTLTLNGTSTTVMEVNKTDNSSDLVTGASTITYGGTLVLKNLNGALQVGDTFTLFTAGTRSGSFSSVVSQTPNQTVTWDVSQLNANGTVKVATAVATPATITTTVSGGNLTLSWPASQIGWQLQSQVNPLTVGLSTNWVTVSGSTSTNQITVPVHSTEPTEFFRLVFPQQ